MASVSKLKKGKSHDHGGHMVLFLLLCHVDYPHMLLKAATEELKSEQMKRKRKEWSSDMVFDF